MQGILMKRSIVISENDGTDAKMFVEAKELIARQLALDILKKINWTTTKRDDMMASVVEGSIYVLSVRELHAFIDELLRSHDLRHPLILA